MQRGKVKTTLLATILGTGVAALYGQVNLATLSGSAQDPQGRPVQSVTVQLVSQGTEAVRTAVLNTAGLFEFAALTPGDYELRIRAAGFAQATRRLRLEVGQQMRLDIALSLGEEKETVSVVGLAETLKTTDVSLGEVIETQSIRELPLNGRMLIDLVLTVPGAHIGHGAQTGDMNPLYWRPGQRSALTIGGNRPNANYFLLDGSTNTDPTFNTMNLSPSPDAVLEFKVQTGSYSAELGGAGGGQVNIVTKSGSNTYHGTAYEYLRNGAMDALSYNEMPGTRHLVQNNFGASLGGPVTREKTFFFANYESLRKSEAMTAIDTVPTAAEAAGDFSQSGVNIFNPASSHANPNYDPSRPASASNPQILRDQFPGNVIPAAMISPVASTMLGEHVPLPNMMGDSGMGMTMMGQPTVVGAGLDSNNYLDVRNSRHRNDQGTVRVDRVFSRGDSLSGRYSVSRENGVMPQNLPGFGALHDNLAQQGNVAWNRVFTPQVLNTVQFAVSRLVMHRSSETNQSNDIVSELGIQGVGFGGKGAYGAPWFNVQGYSGFGDSYAATPMHAWDTLYEGRDTLSWQKGRHSFKFGGSYRRFIWPMWGFFQNRGYYQFTNGFTTQTANNDGTGSALASFLLGLPAVRQRQAGIPSMDLRQWSADSFVQDTWRLTSGTTIDVGLRYEFMSALRDVSRPSSNLLLEGGQLRAFIEGRNGMPSGLMYPNKLRFAPRFGIAHQNLRTGLVFRAAYGVFYTPVDLNTWCNERHNVPLVFPETNQSNNFIPSINGFNFGPPVLGKTVVSFAAFDPHPPAQYIEQWSASIEKGLAKEIILEAGYQGARGFHLQRSHLINNALPGPGPIQPRRPYQHATFLDGTVFPPDVQVQSATFPVSSINLLEDTARSWYDAGYVNLRRRFSSGFSLLANYTYAKNLSDAPDFRSPMFESATPQNNNDLIAEKGPSCDIRHRLAVSAVYDVPALKFWRLSQAVTRNWRLSGVYQIQSGFPFTVSVFGDTANAGTALGENPIRADYTGQPVFGPGTRTSDRWFNPAAFTVPAAYTFGNVGRNTVYGPGTQTLDLALVRELSLSEKGRLQLRGEFFNAANHVNLGTPNRFVNTPQFGTITEASTPGRQIQLGARYSFYTAAHN